MIFDAAFISQPGPRSINEDEAAFWSLQDDYLVAAVADGLGGMGGGADASRIAVAALRRGVTTVTTESDLRAVAQRAHMSVLEAQQTAPELRKMATTLTAGLFGQGHLIGVHCGDSRASIARGNGIIRLTEDHSEGERLFKAGKISKEDLKEYPRKNILDSALGIHSKPKIDTFKFNITYGDRVFFTTDGVHQKILLREMRECSARHERANAFVAEVADIVSSRGADDNFSLLAVFVH